MARSWLTNGGVPPYFTTMENTTHTPQVTVNTHLSREQRASQSLDSQDALGHMRNRRRQAGLNELVTARIIAKRLIAKLETLVEEIDRDGFDADLTCYFSVPGETRGLDTMLSRFETQRNMVETLDEVVAAL